MSNTETSTNADPVIAVHDTRTAAEATIAVWSRAGFDMKKLSIIGKGYPAEGHSLGFYAVGDRIQTWGGVGSFWGAIWGLPVAPAVFVLPAVGLVAVAGPFAQALVAALESPAVVGGPSALGAALYGLGISKSNAIKYEADVEAGRFLVIVHDLADDIAKARAVLATMPHPETMAAAAT